MRNTTVELKNKLFPVFTKLMQDEYIHGGLKYAGNETMEWTDIICEKVGVGWILGTMLKYIGRIINGDRRASRDIVKVAVYAFIYWIKVYSEELENVGD